MPFKQQNCWRLQVFCGGNITKAFSFFILLPTYLLLWGMRCQERTLVWSGTRIFMVKRIQTTAQQTKVYRTNLWLWGHVSSFWDFSSPSSLHFYCKGTAQLSVKSPSSVDTRRSTPAQHVRVGFDLNRYPHCSCLLWPRGKTAVLWKTLPNQETTIPIYHIQLTRYPGSFSIATYVTSETENCGLWRKASELLFTGRF